MNSKSQAWAFAAFFVVLAVLVFWIAIFLPRDAGSKEQKIFVAQKGEGSREIAFHLEKQGFIRSAPVFRVWALTFGLSKKFQAGAYLLSPAMSAEQIGEKLAQGDVVKEFITIPEGWSRFDVARLLEQQKLFSSQDFLAATKDKEGYLFPDTYQISRAQTLKDVVDTMLKNFQTHFAKDLQDETAKQHKTVNEIVTMASLLEKEVQILEDKKIVSGILWKRLQYGIPLQVDAAPGTYQSRGLPSHPIANPGLKSIFAALYPTQSPYLYYLSAHNGKTIFSKSLEEHNAAKAKYLRY